MTSYASITALLKTAILLLSLAQGPNVPQSLHDQAVRVANQAISAATLALGGAGTGPMTSTSTLASTNASCKPFPDETLILPCAQGQLGKHIKKRFSQCILDAAEPRWTDWILQTNTCMDASLLNRSWDPGMLHRRAAFYKVSTTTSSTNYYESCPDDPGGCFNKGKGVPIGGGFYTLSPDIGGETPCRINSIDSFAVKYANGTTRPEVCPYFFSWTQDRNGRLAAELTVDSSLWTNSYTPNMFFGFHDQLPQGKILNGSNYFGSRDLPFINNAHTTVDLSGAFSTFFSNDNSRARMLAGVSWYVPGLQKSFVIEINLGNSGSIQQEPLWSTSAIARENPNCPISQKCIYIGAEKWSLPVIGTQTTSYAIDWSSIAKQLVDLGYLPRDSFGQHQITDIYFGPEVIGRVQSQMQVSNLHTFVEFEQ